jgi:1-deoxy-D-xylulose-5-phosphate reductoisomerase
MPTPAQRLNLVDIARLDFGEPDLERFPALRLAREALEAGGSAPAVLNAANEVAVATFLDGRIQFPDISRLVESALERNERPGPQSIEDVFEIDREVRRDVTMLIEELCA